MLEQFGFDADYTVKCIEANRHNNITSAYHLMYKKAQRQNKPYVLNNKSHVTSSVDRATWNSGQGGNTAHAGSHKRGTSTGYNNCRNNAHTLQQSIKGGEGKTDLNYESTEHEVNE